MNIQERQDILKFLKNITIQGWLDVFKIENISELVSSYENLMGDIRNSIILKNGTEQSTFVDRDLNNIFISKISERFPNFGIISEEGGSKKINVCAPYFVIDSLCGTDNLVNGIMHFCTAITLIEKDKTQIAAVYDPVGSQLFYSIGENKSYCNKNKIHVSETSLVDGLILISDGSSDKAGN